MPGWAVRPRHTHDVRRPRRDGRAPVGRPDRRGARSIVRGRHGVRRVSWDPRGAIAAKRDGRPVPDAEIERLLAEYGAGSLGDGPMAAFLMAAVLRGMSRAETATMTRAFVSSGVTVDLGDVGRPVVDKHS